MQYKKKNETIEKLLWLMKKNFTRHSHSEYNFVWRTYIIVEHWSEAQKILQNVYIYYVSCVQ
jgi:hypothetical protein